MLPRRIKKNDIKVQYLYNKMGSKVCLKKHIEGQITHPFQFSFSITSEIKTFLHKYSRAIAERSRASIL